MSRSDRNLCFEIPTPNHVFPCTQAFLASKCVNNAQRPRSDHSYQGSNVTLLMEYVSTHMGCHPFRVVQHQTSAHICRSGCAQVLREQLRLLERVQPSSWVGYLSSTGEPGYSNFDRAHQTEIFTSAVRSARCRQSLAVITFDSCHTTASS